MATQPSLQKCPLTSGTVSSLFCSTSPPYFGGRHNTVSNFRGVSCALCEDNFTILRRVESTITITIQTVIWSHFQLTVRQLNLKATPSSRSKYFHFQQFVTWKGPRDKLRRRIGPPSFQLNFHVGAVHTTRIYWLDSLSTHI